MKDMKQVEASSAGELQTNGSRLSVTQVGEHSSQ